MQYYEWYMSVTGGAGDSGQPPPPPGFESGSGFHHMDDSDGAPPGMDMPPGMEAPPGMEMPPGF